MVENTVRRGVTKQSVAGLIGFLRVRAYCRARVARRFLFGRATFVTRFLTHKGICYCPARDTGTPYSRQPILALD